MPLSSPPTAIDLDDPGSFWARQLVFARRKQAYRMELSCRPAGDQWDLILQWRAGPGQVSKTVRVPPPAMEQWRCSLSDQPIDRYVVLAREGVEFRLRLSNNPCPNLFASLDLVRLWPWCRHLDELKKMEADTAAAVPRKAALRL